MCVSCNHRPVGIDQSNALTVVGGVWAALSIGSPCWCGAIITAAVGGGATLPGVLSGERRSCLRTHANKPQLLLSHTPQQNTKTEHTTFRSGAVHSKRLCTVTVLLTVGTAGATNSAQPSPLAPWDAVTPSWQQPKLEEEEKTARVTVWETFGISGATSCSSRGGNIVAVVCESERV